MMQRRTAMAVALGVWMAMALSACQRKTPGVVALPAGTTVLALGDSLTAGVGARGGEDWPSLLAGHTGWEVVNAGVSGDTAAQGLARLPALLLEHRPRLVIVGLGGNDFLRRIAPSQTIEALEGIVQQIRAMQAQPLLVAIPQPSLMAVAGGTLSDHPLYEELAERLQVPLLSKLWGPVLAQPQLRADQVHANAQGYAAFAESLVQTLRSQGWLAQE